MTEPAVAVWAQAWTLIGRGEELALLETFLASDSAHGAVLIGPAGSGKSRLARELARRRGRDRGRVVFAQGTASAATIPFGAVADLLPSPRQGLSDRPGALRAVAADLRGSPGPTLVIIDDAHLLDEASGALALHLVLTESADLLVCLREGEPAPDAVTALWKDDYLQRVDLQPLSDAEVAAMVRSALPGSVAPDVIAWVQQRSIGYPLFVVELVRGAIAEGLLCERDGEWGFAAAPRAPQRMRDLIGQRLADLAPAQQAALEVLALAEPLAYAQALQLVGPEPLAELEQRGLVTLEATVDDRPLAVRLAHPLYGEVALAELPRTRRDAAARRLADALWNNPARSPSDVLRAVRWRREAGHDLGTPELVQASAAAAGIFDPMLALEYARQAHAKADTLGTALAMASPLVTLARFAEVEALLAPYELREASEEEAGRALGLRVVALQLGLRRTSDALALLDRYTGAYSSDAWRRRLREGRIGVTTHAGHLLQAAELLREMLADPAATDEDFRRAYSGAYALVFAGDSKTATRFAERVLNSADAPAADEIEVLAWFAAHSPAVGSDRVEPVLEPMLENALQAGNVVLAGICARLLGTAALEHGRVVSAQKRLEATVELLQAQDPFALQVSVLAMLAEAQALQRNVSGAGNVLAAAEELLASRPATWVEEAGLARARLRIALADDRPVQAQQMALEAASRAGQVITRRAILLHEALRAGASASQVVHDLQQLAARCDLRSVAACAQHAVASARGDGGALTIAAEGFRRIGAQLHAAEIHAEAAVAYSTSDDRPRAVAAAERSRQFAERCEGAWTPMLRLADAATHRLTPREAEVAALAGHGLTNAEIADRLVLSVRTIDSHLRRVYSKLGINRRSQLAAVLAID